LANQVKSKTAATPSFKTEWLGGGREMLGSAKPTIANCTTRHNDKLAAIVAKIGNNNG